MSLAADGTHMSVAFSSMAAAGIFPTDLPQLPYTGLVLIRGLHPAAVSPTHTAQLSAVAGKGDASGAGDAVVPDSRKEGGISDAAMATQPQAGTMSRKEF